MRIADVNAFYAPAGGGVRGYVDRKLAAAAGLGLDLTVIAPGPEDRVEAHGSHARVRWLRTPPFPLDRRYHYFDGAAPVHAAIDDVRPDLIEASSPWSTATIVADWPGTAPRAFVMHADPLAAYAYRWFSPVASLETIDRRFDWFWRRLRRFDQAFDLIVSPSAGLAARLAAGGLTRVETITLGLTDRVFSPRHRSPDLRRYMLDQCGLGPEALLLLGVGRFSSEKRWPMVIEAVTAASYHRPIGLVLIGAGRDEPRLVRAIGGNPHVRLHGEVNDRLTLAQAMASADALVHGCEAETFCLVAAEARASGLPLIVPDRGGASDQATAPCDRIYEAGSGKDLARVLTAFEPSRPMFGSRPRMLADHFAELAGRYRRLLDRSSVREVA